MDSSGTVDRRIYSACKDRLLFNSLESQPIMYSNDRAYEYNYNTHKIRPFTSVIWYSLSNSEYDDFIFYLDNDIQISIANKYDEPNEYSPISFDRDTMKIDISKLKCKMIEEGDTKSYISFSRCFSFLKKIYDTNYESLCKEINRQSDII